MTPFLTKRLLINLAVVAAAVGANAFVAYTQICGQRDADARTVRSTAIRQNLEAYRATLEGGLGVLGRYEASATPAPAEAAAGMSASLAKIDRALHEQLENQPKVADALAQLTSDGTRLQQDIALALAKATAPEQDGSRAWAAQTYTRLGMEVDGLEARMEQLRAQEDLSLKAALDASMRDSRYAMLFLIVTMLAGSGLLIYTFGARENVAREKLRIAKALHRHDERFRGLFEQHPVPMYIFY